jgi:tRNASer (uridine44-2'-O)-methyltransferase
MANVAGPSRPKEVPTEAMEQLVRPPFRPETRIHTCPLEGSSANWVEHLSVPVQFGLSSFVAAIRDLALHPERNSSLILRADPLPPPDPYDGPEGSLLKLNKVEELKVRLMPKQPNRDGKLDQRIIFFSGRDDGLVLMIPDVSDVGDIPFYHPPVIKLAFRYEAIVEETGSEIIGRIHIAYLPFATTPAGLLAIRPVKARRRSPLATEGMIDTKPVARQPLDTGSVPEDRLHRTCLGLLERVYKYGYGDLLGYQKRVHHDVRHISTQLTPGCRPKRAISRPVFDTQRAAPPSRFPSG